MIVYRYEVVHHYLINHHKVYCLSSVSRSVRQERGAAEADPRALVVRVVRLLPPAVVVVVAPRLRGSLNIGRAFVSYFRAGKAADYLARMRNF